MSKAILVIMRNGQEPIYNNTTMKTLLRTLLVVVFFMTASKTTAQYFKNNGIYYYHSSNGYIKVTNPRHGDREDRKKEYSGNIDQQHYHTETRREDRKKSSLQSLACDLTVRKPAERIGKKNILETLSFQILWSIKVWHTK